MTSEQIKKEILSSGLSAMDEEILLWYLGICRYQSQWMAFVGCHFQNRKRLWYVTDKLIKLSRGVKP